MARHTGTYLDRILADTAAALAARTDLPTAPPSAPPTRGFARALAAPGMSLIAEVKKASPSRGVIRADFHPADIARAYQAAGASAISVLTDEKYFQGKLAYLDEVRVASTLPLLRKDFIIHPAQIFEAVGRADAVLLIVAALSPDELAALLALATSCGLDTLVEVHDRAELDTALAAGAPVIGINNRDLRTFVIDLQTTFRLLPYIPADRIIVSESGVQSAAQVTELAQAGVHAILVGESLMVSDDIPAKVRELLGRSADVKA
ncbi:MAG TPA: indole-3-glycerol phosphate synthase TrpC [Armatimonadota bacterium]|jgi:indole-3-glycerol phosphate synthase